MMTRRTIARWTGLCLGLVCALVPLGCTSAPADEPASIDVEFRIRVPQDTPSDAKVYLAGNLKALGGWKPNGLALRRTADGQYRARVVIPKGGILEYKTTLGSWQTVEKGPNGEEIPNRQVFLDHSLIVEIAVKSWAKDDPAKSRSTRTGDIRIHEAFPSDILKVARTLSVYLPPSYEADSDTRYPVLYLHDGQNVFDRATSFLGVEWSADETAEEYIKKGWIRPMIIVAIDNVPARVDEYTPYHDPVRRLGGKADLYARFVVKEVKPFIDKTYHTRPGREDTAVAGASLGGLASLHIAKCYPDVFSMCGVISPALWWKDDQILKDLESKDVDGWLKRTRFWVDMGTREGARGGETSPELPRTRRLVDRLKSAGLRAERDYSYQEVLGATHDEGAWASRFGSVLEFFFPGPVRRPPTVSNEDAAFPTEQAQTAKLTPRATYRKYRPQLRSTILQGD